LPRPLAAAVAAVFRGAIKFVQNDHKEMIWTIRNNQQALVALNLVLIDALVQQQ